MLRNCLDILKYLLDLLKKEWNTLQVHLNAVFLDSEVKCLIIRLGQLHAREQIRCDTMEQRQIMAQELRKIDINDGSQHENIFFLVWVF